MHSRIRVGLLVCLLGVVALPVAVRAQVVFLEDDFEDYFDVFEVEDIGEWRLVDAGNPTEMGSKWTITSPGSRAKPPTEDGTPSAGTFIISDSDAQTESNPTGSDTFLDPPIVSYSGGGLFDGAEEPFYAERIFSVPRAAGEAEVAFAFHYRGLVAGAAFWGVTDVSVTGEGGPQPVRFRRGDPDNSGGGSITDAIAVLNHLFAGEARPVCWGAADVNGAGGINVSDPVYHLNFLFGGGSPPPPPPGPGDCGDATAADEALGCDEYTSC